MNATVPRIAFLDWLKALGIIIILLGHLAGGYTNRLAPPIYPKQLGVAFFIFAMAYTLALEKRPARQVLFSRLFEVLLWGVLIAAVMTAVSMAAYGTAALSNYLPFLFGANVLIDHFPANPTTWYIGTYIHLLLLWCVIRNVEVSWPMIGGIAAVEIACRVVLMQSAGLHIAYMVVPNWAVVFAGGLLAGRKRLNPRSSIAMTAVAVIGSVAWYFAIWPFVADETVPFMRMQASNVQLGFLFTSCLVTILYAGWTALVGLVFGSVGAPGWVRVIARNTLVIFIAHMPLFYWLDPILIRVGWGYAARSVTELTACLVGLTALSEFVHRVVPIREWRVGFARRLFA